MSAAAPAHFWLTHFLHSCKASQSTNQRRHWPRFMWQRFMINRLSLVLSIPLSAAASVWYRFLILCTVSVQGDSLGIERAHNRKRSQTWLTGVGYVANWRTKHVSAKCALFWPSDDEKQGEMKRRRPSCLTMMLQGAVKPYRLSLLPYYYKRDEFQSRDLSVATL